MHLKQMDKKAYTTDSKWQYFIRVNIEMDKLLACCLKYVSEKMKHIHNNFLERCITSIHKY